MTLGPRRILYSIYITPESKWALEALAKERGEQTATTVRAMLAYALLHMPKDYHRVAQPQKPDK